MIRQTTDIDALISRLRQDPIGNIYPLSILQGYPKDDAFYRAYQSENGILVYAGGTAYLSGEFEQDELSSFLAMLGVAEIVQPNPRGNKHILVYEGTALPSTADYMQESQLRDVWQLLKRSFDNIPDYTEFYQAKTAQRLYLGGKTGVIMKDELASTASVLMQTDTHALLGAVATHINHRKQGHAANILYLLIDELLQNNKTPIILCDNPVALHLYRGMGFEEYGKMTVKPYVFQ